MKKIMYTAPEVKEVFLEAEGVIMGFGSQGTPIAYPTSMDYDYDDEEEDYGSLLNRNLRRPW